MINFIPWALLLLALCAPFEVSASARATLALEADEEKMELRIRNDGPGDVEVSAGFSLAGLSGGNVIAIIVSDHGQIMPPCVHLDSFNAAGDPRILRPGGQVRAWIGSPKPFAWTHCLSPGRYRLSFAYRFPNGDIEFSNGFFIRVRKGQGLSVER